MIIDIQRYWGEREIFYAGELASKIIHGMQTHGKITLRSKEPRNAQISGLFPLLDQLCDFWKWDKSLITLETANVFERHPHYDIRVTYFNESFARIKTETIDKVSWDGSRLYGMFIGRANVTRLRAIQRHRDFEYRDLGLASFNHDIRQQIDMHVVNEFLTATDCRASEIMDIEPYSDIGPVIRPPITGQFLNSSWEEVYRQIPLEIVCATGENEGTASLDEKIIRPIMYRRPFILIGAKNVVKDYFKNFRNLMQNNKFFYPNGTQLDYRDFQDLRFFENVISLDYDQDHGIHRVDHVFDILRDLIKSKKIYSILEDCADDIEWNYQTIVSAMQNFKNRCAPGYDDLWDYDSWKKPTYL